MRYFEFIVMPFGFINAPTSFITLINQVFREYLDVFVVVFISVILFYFWNVEEYEDHLKKVLDILRDKK